MSSTVLKIAAVLTVLLALVLAGLAWYLSRQYSEVPAVAPTVSSSAPVAADEPRERAVVALKRLPAWEAVPAEAVRLAPVAAKPEGAFVRAEDVVGRVPVMDIDAGAPLAGRHFEAGNALARLVPAGFQALSMEVNDVIAVGGFLRPGDVVDVLVYLRGGSGVDQPQARALMRGLRVLAFDDRMVDQPEPDPRESANRRRQRSVVLAVPEKDATRLLLGSAMGEVRLALHGQVDALAAPELALDEASGDDSGNRGQGGGQLARGVGTSVAGGGPASPAGAAASAVPVGATVSGAALGDAPVTAAQLTRTQAATGTARHRVYVYRGSDVQTVLD